MESANAKLASSPAKVAPPISAEAERALFLAFTDHRAGRLDSAVSWYRQAIAIAPDFPEAFNNLGIALKDLHRFADAIAAYREALRLSPERAEIWNNLGDSLHSLGDRAAAIAQYRRALAIDPKYAIGWRNLGDALLEDGAIDAANECFAKAVALGPDLDSALSPTEVGLRDIKRYYAKLVEEIERALSRDPQLAACYGESSSGKEAPPGCSEATATRYRLVANMRSSYANHLSSLLGALHYDPASSPNWLYEAHGEADRFYRGMPRFTHWPNSRDRDRRLRVGYVSADFKRHHSVGYFLAAAFLAHDPNAVEIHCYSNSPDDEETSFFKSLATSWRPILNIKDEELADIIRDDGIDILVDLSGHTYGNRLGVFARRPAPIQITWLGYSDTTGLSSIDYRLTDAIVDPPGDADRRTSERLVRIPKGFHCYTAPAEAPDVGPAPATANGYITFGSLNNLIKVNATVLDHWAAILKRSPASRLLLKAKWLDVPEMQRRVFDNFERRGIASDRIELLTKKASTADHLAVYHQVDIALDTFPYNGVTTTCEALWMGVPVVTLAGGHHAARVGASLLSQVGLGELVAATPQAYIDTAIALALNHDRRTQLRADLRTLMARSPLCDRGDFARRLEETYRMIWQAWCNDTTA